MIFRQVLLGNTTVCFFSFLVQAQTYVVKLTKTVIYQTCRDTNGHKFAHTIIYTHKATLMVRFEIDRKKNNLATTGMMLDNTVCPRLITMYTMYAPPKIAYFLFWVSWSAGIHPSRSGIITVDQHKTNLVLLFWRWHVRLPCVFDLVMLKIVAIWSPNWYCGTQLRARLMLALILWIMFLIAVDTSSRSDALRISIFSFKLLF